MKHPEMDKDRNGFVERHYFNVIGQKSESN